MAVQQVAKNPGSCDRCLYLADCCMYWKYCPYDGRPVDEKKERAKLCKELGYIARP